MSIPIFSLQRVGPEEGPKTLHATVAGVADAISSELAPVAIETMQRVSMDDGTYSPLAAGGPYIVGEVRRALSWLVLAPEDKRRAVLGFAGDAEHPGNALLRGPTVRYAIGVEGLAPGIWRTVAWLQGNDFDTVDSGDGVANVAAGMEGAIPLPNVHMRVDPGRLVGEADRLRSCMAQVVLDDAALDGVQFIASYDAADGSAVLSLIGFGDEKLVPLRNRLASSAG